MPTKWAPNSNKNSTRWGNEESETLSKLPEVVNMKGCSRVCQNEYFGGNRICVRFLAS
jgi:hypothetical protein